jgi:hypothetical protein
MNQIATAPLDDLAREQLSTALHALAAPSSLIVRAADAMGRLLGSTGHRVLATMGLNPDSATLTSLAEAALTRAYDVAILGLSFPGPGPQASGPLVAISGFAGGFAGFAGFLPDATFTTLMIMREIARIARESGEDLSTEEGRVACVQVFALRRGDESGYLSARFMLQGTAARGLLTRVATSWGAVLGEKFAAQAVPVAGAVAGATLNTAFLNHYRALAQAHFTMRRLRRVHGEPAVQQAVAAIGPVRDEKFMEE